MSSLVFTACVPPDDLAARLCDRYGLSDSFRGPLAAFLGQAPTTCVGDYASMIARRLGFRLPQAYMFLECEWPVSLLGDFEQQVLTLRGCIR